MKGESAARHVSYTRLSCAAMREVQEHSLSPSPSFSLSLSLMYSLRVIMFQKKKMIKKAS